MWQKILDWFKSGFKGVSLPEIEAIQTPIVGEPGVISVPMEKPTVSKTKVVPTPDTWLEYEAKFNAMRIRAEKLATVNARADLLHKFSGSHYAPVAKAIWGDTRFWFLVALIHNQENGSDVGIFKAVLHNGERIIGTGRKTTIVPKGRGPFSSWPVAAIDALSNRKDETIKHIGGMLSFLERYNGLGYRNHGVATPYLWAMTDQYTKGHFAGDGNWKPNELSKNFGAAAILKAMVMKRYVMVDPVPSAKTEHNNDVAQPIESGTKPPDTGKPTSTPTGEILSARDLNFLRVAGGLEYRKEAMDLIVHWRKKHPGKDAQFRMLVDFSLPDTKKRSFLIDCDTSGFEPHRVSHGAGSDPNRDGIATEFSDKNNSHQSSLGIYRVGETYQGKHGYSCRLDGESDSNDSARARAVVIHSAAYVSDKDGVLHTGDSWGCFVFDPAKSQGIIDKLKNGSPLYAFKG